MPTPPHRVSIQKLQDWGYAFPVKSPLVIAGPCSAETRDQTLETCQAVAKNGAHILRAGIWKPRSRPHTFAGVGWQALEWLKEAGTKTGLPVICEVASDYHVQEVIRHGIDMVWIGARSTANPFLVQEIIDALKGHDIPVFIKNPVNPDLDLWIGAIERCLDAGLSRVAVIHRGFSVSRMEPYRNSPIWEIPIELKRRLPTIPLICDPSHICGKRFLLNSVAQRAMDLAYDGLMIEVHPDPDHAWSDAAQQLTPDAFLDLLNELVIRRKESADPDFTMTLDSLRAAIDALDKEIIELLGRRMEISREIGFLKKENGITILQNNRWAHIFDDRVQNTLDAGLSEKFAQAFIQSIHLESIRQQNSVMNGSMDIPKDMLIIPEEK